MYFSLLFRILSAKLMLITLAVINGKLFSKFLEGKFPKDQIHHEKLIMGPWEPLA